MAGNRNSIIHKAGRALRRPALIAPYVRRVMRNRKIRRATASHPEFYRAVMADDVRRKTAKGAVGTEDPARWDALGKKQAAFLIDHGLEPGHRLLEIGCGNLRAGHHFIDYLDVGNYVGVDISPEILLAAQDTVVAHSLEAKRPALFLVDGSRLSFLPSDHFDVAHAHSVFTHTPLEIVESYLREAHRVLREGGIFDFTYHHSDGDVWGFLDEDFYFPTSLLLEIAGGIGYDGHRMENWDYVQPKIRLVKRP